MGLNTAADIANQLNGGDGHIITWKTIAWLIANDKGGSDSPHVEFWLDRQNWVRLCEISTLDTDTHVSRQHPQTDNFWVSQTLKALADRRSWEMF